MRIKFSKTIAVMAIILVIAFAFSGCNRNDNGEIEDVTVVLDWIPNTNHVGLFVAQEKGFFEDVGLNVNIVEAPEFNFVEMVGINSAQFGIAAQEQLSQARESGNVPVVAIAAILQENTSGFAAPVNRGIKSPKDFEGKTYSGWGTPLEEKFIETLMEKDGGDFSLVEMRMMGATDYFASMETEADFAWIYYGWDGIGSTIIDYPLDFILLQDIDENLNFYSPIFISNEETLENSPHLAEKFLEAVSKGYEFAVENPEEAADMLLIHTPETNRDHAIASIEYLSDFFLDEDGKFGTMKEEVWVNFSEFMYQNDLLSERLDVENSYTNEFLK